MKDNNEIYDLTDLDKVFNDRRTEKDRRKQRFVPAQVNINIDGIEITITGGSATVMKCKDGAYVTVTGAFIDKK
ncbi:hypothetical protein V2P20_09185 [Methylobacter sp. Wu1]|uniref:hypothetical protein n=1 Tax=Methylobacter sp. Wu1 TaxID=3119359 RepID=UPI002F94720C